MENISQKSIICDAILKKFDGNTHYTWKLLHEESFYKSINESYFVVENHIKYLLGENILHENSNNATSAEFVYIQLSSKGWFMMTNIDTEGFVAIERKSKEKERAKDDREIKTLDYAKKAFIIGVIGAILTALTLIKCNNTKGDNTKYKGNNRCVISRFSNNII